MPARARTAKHAGQVLISKPSMINRVAFDGSTGTWGPAPPEARFAADEKPVALEPDGPCEMPARESPLHEMYAGPPSATTIGELPATSSPRAPPRDGLG
jgi:hypothetical protein